MTDTCHVLLIVGSPRRKESTSHALASAICDLFGGAGCVCREVFAVNPEPPSAEVATLVSAVEVADIVFVICPLYVDQLPAGVVAALEQIHEASPARTVKRRRLVGVVNCGFPESSQNDTALEILKRFAELDGMEWAGGLSRGMGGAIGGRPLDRAGLGGNGVSQALTMAVDSLVGGGIVSDVAIDLMARPPMPKWVYLFFGNLGWYRDALRLGVLRKLRDIP